jgi:D-alanyl-lipoteichoic acid acyltransferase DltB (MBOAT superfamily)
VIFLQPAFLAFALATILLAQSRERGLGSAGVALVVDLAFLLIFLGPAQSAILIGFTLAGYGAVQLQGRRGALPFAVVAILIAFVVLKKYAFLPEWLRPASLPVAIGLSYVLFRQLHLLVDRAQGSGPAPALAMHLHYSLDCRAIVSGPFQRFEEHEALLREAPRADVLPAMARMADGFLKVALVSPLLLAFHARLLPARDAVWAASLQGEIGLIHALTAAALWLVYMYFNFSGYTDIVIAWSRLCRLDLPENFDRPLLATGFLAFWSRWHMTMTNWFKTYLFSPLMMTFARHLPGRKGAVAAAAAAFFFTFLLVGVWHGPTASFIVCGLLLGVGATVNQISRELLRKRKAPAIAASVLRLIGSAAAFVYIAVAVSPFWLEDRRYFQLLHALARPRALVAIAAALIGGALIVVVLRALDSALRAMVAPLGAKLHAPLAIALRLVVVVPVALATSDALPRFVYQGI